MKGLSRASAMLLASLPLFLAQRAGALVYCVTNVVDYHRNAPTGELANSGWSQTVPIDKFLGTLIYTNAMLNAGHIWELNVGDRFTYEGASHTVTAIMKDAPASDLSILFFTGAVTNYALLNIETNETGSFVVLQGRGAERGDVVATGGRTNGWKWTLEAWKLNPNPTRRWGVNRYVGEAETNGVCAVAAFDNNGDPDECMLSVGDSGGPGFIRTGSGWKLATVNSGVEPLDFNYSNNLATAFQASLYDYAGLYYKTNGVMRYQPPEASPSPCVMLNTRVAKRIAWITNTVAGITFPADVGVRWRCETNRPSGSQAAEGLWFEVVATNAGPYTARDLALDITWHRGLHLCGAAASRGTFATNRWSLPALEDGGAATLRVDTVVWRSAAEWGTNRVSVTSSDKPDSVTSNNSATCAVFLPETATRLLVQ